MNEPLVVLITPTGGRKEQIKLCAKWMSSQTYKGRILWIIVDDCVPVTTDFIQPDFRENWTIKHIFPQPAWKVGENTQCRNLLAGLYAIPVLEDIKGIFIIEDDDYYTSIYIEEMLKLLNGFDLCGESDTIYYNVQTRTSINNRNRRHSSLFQTAFMPVVLPYLEKILKKGALFVDMELFKIDVSINLFSGRQLSIGIKGMPGRAGIGRGHLAHLFTANHSGINDDLLSYFKVQYVTTTAV